MSKRLSWKPKRKGDIYCAPACGASCKYEDYLDAKKRAKALCDKLGKGFKPSLHENMKWYWRVENGNVSVSPRGDGTYSATYDNTIWAYGKTAKGALAKLLSMYIEENDRFTAIVEELSKVV